MVIDRDRWQHIIEQHPEMAHHLAEIMATVGTPEHDGPDRAPIGTATGAAKPALAAG